VSAGGNYDKEDLIQSYSFSIVAMRKKKEATVRSELLEKRIPTEAQQKKTGKEQRTSKIATTT